jgi:hypothetical protein
LSRSQNHDINLSSQNHGFGFFDAPLGLSNHVHDKELADSQFATKWKPKAQFLICTKKKKMWNCDGIRANSNK